jgi:hypothetical protein
MAVGLIAGVATGAIVGAAIWLWTPEKTSHSRSRFVLRDLLVMVSAIAVLSGVIALVRQRYEQRQLKIERVIHENALREHSGESGPDMPDDK